MTQNINPVHPGTTLLNDFMGPAGLSIARLAAITGIPTNIITDIVDEKCNVTADVALGLAQQFGVSVKFWLNLQSHYDLEVAHKAAARNAS